MSSNSERVNVGEHTIEIRARSETEGPYGQHSSPPLPPIGSPGGSVCMTPLCSRSDIVHVPRIRTPPAPGTYPPQHPAEGQATVQNHHSNSILIQKINLMRLAPNPQMELAEDVFTEFAQYGDIQGMKVRFNNNVLIDGEALCQYYNAEDAAKAVEGGDGKIWDGRAMQVELLEPGHIEIIDCDLSDYRRWTIIKSRWILVSNIHPAAKASEVHELLADQPGFRYREAISIWGSVLALFRTVDEAEKTRRELGEHNSYDRPLMVELAQWR